MKEICFRKINEFFKEQYQLMKINKIMKEETNSPKDRNQSSSNSDTFDSGSGSGNGTGNGNTVTNEGGKSEAMSENLKKTKKMAKYASNILKEWFTEHIEDPYPSKEEKIMLASKTNLTLRQVNIFCSFFLNWQIF